ncbi:MAG: GNAT family N-acetyltransferase [Candidatus Limnocylindrales bacterium]
MEAAGAHRIEPLTPERWADLEALFGRGGGSYGCWCMYFRRSSTEMAAAKAAENREALRAMADADPPPGLLAYDGDVPVGWVGLGPRSSFTRIVRSRFIHPVDELPAWSVVCFFVTRPSRGGGVARALLAGAVDCARGHRAPAIEGYARDPGGERLAADSAYPGTVSLFRGAGFREAARVQPADGRSTRVIMRLEF